jgi:hypothetical protein
VGGRDKPGQGAFEVVHDNWSATGFAEPEQWA